LNICERVSMVGYCCGRSVRVVLLISTAGSQSTLRHLQLNGRAAIIWPRTLQESYLYQGCLLLDYCN